jgi:hypothetical protein
MKGVPPLASPKILVRNYGGVRGLVFPSPRIFLLSSIGRDSSLPTKAPSCDNAAWKPRWHRGTRRRALSSINVMVAQRRAMLRIPPAPTLVAFRRLALSFIVCTATIYKWEN